MTFKELDIGDYFIEWEPFNECYYMYCKNSEYAACQVDDNLNESPFGIMRFRSDDKVYKVIV